MNAQLLMTPDKQVYLNFQPANPSANQHQRDAPDSDNDNPNNGQMQGELLQSMDNEKPITGTHTSHNTQMFFYDIIRFMSVYMFSNFIL